jgi:hypothetical protein
MKKNTVKTPKIQHLGHLGTYSDMRNVYSFSMGDFSTMFDALEDLDTETPIYHNLSNQMYSTLIGPNGQPYNVLWRGYNNRKCEEIERDVKQNRLLPRLYKKQSTMLYGQSLLPYRRVVEGGKFIRQWEMLPEVQAWLDSWQVNGLSVGYQETARSFIRNFYTFNDFFVKFRFSRGKRAGIGYPLSGMESLENRQCRLATMRKDVAFSLLDYSDFRMIAVGEWECGKRNYSFFPRFQLAEVDKYNFSAVGHYRDKSVGEMYGLNETHSGTKQYIKGSNQIPRYINSFLRNSLAAKKHIKIPNSSLDITRQQVRELCAENAKLEAEGSPIFLFDGKIELGTVYKESTFMKVMDYKIQRFVDALSGPDRQGKSLISFTFPNSKGGTEGWTIEDIDLKYKEYIETLISYDKRADEVLISSLGIDSSISNISKDGVISKSGADVYYNYLIYLMQLNPEDEICSEPFNVALKINFPSLYDAGFRLGFYRETPNRQEQVAPADRLQNMQS